MKNPLRRIVGLSCAVLLGFASSPNARAALVSASLFTEGDNLIVRDTTAGLDWVKPGFLVNQFAFGAPEYMGLSGLGFRTAGLPALMPMLTSNFPGLALGQISSQGAVAAEQFFATFGVISNTLCVTPTATSCKSTLGTTSAFFSSGLFYAPGVVEFGAGTPDAIGGILIYYDYGAGPDFGVWLNRATPSAVPLPAAAWLLLSGIGSLGAFARRRRSR